MSELTNEIEQNVRNKVAKELAIKILQSGCNVDDIDNESINENSIELWANMTFDYAEELLTENDEPVFTLAELWAVMHLKVEISAYLNNEKFLRTLL